VDAIEGRAAPGLYPVLPLSDTVMADISLDGVEQEIVVGPSVAVESVPATPAQVEIINGGKTMCYKVDYMVRYREGIQTILMKYFGIGIVVMVW